jgi:hypothetical protein
MNNVVNITNTLCQPPVQWIPGATSPGLKRQGREADNSSPSSAKVKNSEAIPPLPHTSSWFGALFIKLSNNFTFIHCIDVFTINCSSS